MKRDFAQWLLTFTDWIGYNKLDKKDKDMLK